MQTSIRCSLMRGGTSKGPFFHAGDLPSDPDTLARVLLAALGSPHVRQIDGVGGGDPVTSKVAIVSRSTRADADIDYKFAQVFVDRPLVDTNPSCGNILTAVAPFAIEEGLFPAQDPVTTVRIHDVNTQSVVTSTVQTPGGRVAYEGDHQIDGVGGSHAPIELNFAAMVGAKTGKLFPTGNRTDHIEGVDVSCVDMAMPVVFVPAEAVGRTGHETKAELDADAELIARLDRIRCAASLRMGMGDAHERVTPKIALVAPPRHGGTLASRYFMPYAVATAYAVTGGTCLATAACLEGTVAHAVARLRDGDPRRVSIEHPQGQLHVLVSVADRGDGVDVKSATLVRHARRLMTGQVHIPASVWAPEAPGEPA